MTIIELQRVKKIYQLGSLEVEALKGVSFSVDKGEFVTIAGPSGSGKSTILNIVGLIDMPNTGKVFLNGKPVFTDKDQLFYQKTGKISGNADSRICKIRKNNIGFIFQSFNLLPVLNVYENIEYPLHLGIESVKDMSKQERREWIEYLISRVGLEKFFTHKPSQLSGGQRQRVAIARSLVTKTPIILADEPTANLDSKTGENILSLMKEMNKEFNTTFIFSTHDRKIMDMADRCIKIKDGQLES
ncbi:MAG: ABC transporter ATP-binding protein [Treponemataceae bacterium]